MQTKRNFILLIIVIIMIASMVGGYFFMGWKPTTKPIEEEEITYSPPILFSADDYKIEEKLEGKFIVIEKVGFSAKAPKGWEVKKEGGKSYYSPAGEEYYITMLSPDATTSEKTNTILGKGCGVSILVFTSDKKEIEEIRTVIDFLKEHPGATTKEVLSGVPLKFFSFTRDYTYKTREISNYSVLEGVLSKNPLFDQIIGIQIPLNEDKLIVLETGFPPGYKEKCLPIWEEFLKTVIIK